MKKTLLDVLESAVREPKSYDEFVQDGAAMQRLKGNQDFQAYQKLLMEAYLVLVKRMESSSTEDLPKIQGALVQHGILLRLPEKVLEHAAKAVESEREAREA